MRKSRSRNTAYSRHQGRLDDDVVRCFIKATLKHSKARLLLKGAKAKGMRVRRVKLPKAKAEALKRGLVARSCADGLSFFFGYIFGRFVEAIGSSLDGHGSS